MKKRATSAAFAFSSALALCGCNDFAGTSTAPVNPIEGYGDVKFGASFTEFIGTHDSSDFNAFGLKHCFEDMATDGCFLSPDEDTTFFDMKDGVPYSLTVEFSTKGKLFHAELGYHREGGITHDQCLSIFERSIDWAQKEFGPLADRHQATGSGFEPRVTRGGVSYRLGVSPGDFFVANVSRTLGAREVWPFGTFIVVDGNPICRVGVNFTDHSLEGRPARVSPS